ncbi:MAG TPA: hypothetical protein PKY59_00265 [Pyrinomonadaceae bacterium]|nr:hypothetical protein [Pyrinomonadaceae bacterium]
MNLLDELGNDLAFAFLVEKRHVEKIDSKEVVVLIKRIKDVLKPISSPKRPFRNFLPIEKKLPNMFS